MLRRRTFVLLLAMALLAFPASSLAQSAGDNQYQDPLAGQGGSSGSSGHHSGSSGSSGSSGNSGSTGSTGSSAPATAPTAAAPSSTGTGTPADPAATGAQASNGQLPRTGFDVILTVELGLAMLLAGLVSHRLLVLRDRR